MTFKLTAALCLALALACGCAPLTVYSRWDAQARPQAIPSQAPPGPELSLSSQNNADSVTLNLSTQSPKLKRQLLGAFRQSFSVWLGRPGGPSQGLRVSFHPKPGVGFPSSEAEEREYWRAATLELDYYEPGRGPKPLIPPYPKGLAFDSALSGGEFSLSLTLPLAPIRALPGMTLSLGMECSPIEMEAAYVELQREYLESLFGWGWGLKGYGPQRKPELGFGIGNLDAWGLDKGPYATHGLYGRPSWESVPSPFSFWSNLKLASNEK